jgi:hypothetical protein
MFHWIYTHVINTGYFVLGVPIAIFLSVFALWFFKTCKADIGDIDEK